MKRVILESPLGNALFTHNIWQRVLPGSPMYLENVRYAKLCTAHCLRNGEAPFASHLLYAQDGIFDDADEGERELGLKAGFAWNASADYVVVYTDRGISPGMKCGIETHLKRGLHVEERKLEGYVPLPLNTQSSLDKLPHLTDDERAIAERVAAAGMAPWTATEDEDCWRLFSSMEAAGHVIDSIKQILKAPKHSTPYAEYWPNHEDAALIINAPSDLKLLLERLSQSRTK